MSHPRGIRTLALAFLLFSRPVRALEWHDFSSSALIEVTRSAGHFTCTGVALSPRVVLTVAHCVEGADSARVTVDFRYDPRLGSFVQVVSGGIFIHPRYQPSQSLFLHDLAALMLAGDLPRGIRYLPILPGAWVLGEGNPLGSVGYGGRQGENRRTWTDVVFQRLESGTVFTQDNLSTLGDSGGPLLLRSGLSLELVGIHSTVITESGGVTAAAVDLREHLGWLEAVTGLRLH